MKPGMRPCFDIHVGWHSGQEIESMSVSQRLVLRADSRTHAVREETEDGVVAYPKDVVFV
jgi:hypothetical protein